MVKKTTPVDEIKSTKTATTSKAKTATTKTKTATTKAKTPKKDEVETTTTAIITKPATKKADTPATEEKTTDAPKLTKEAPVKKPATTESESVPSEKEPKKNKEEATTKETEEVVSGFEGFGLREGVLRGIEKAGYTTPTDIQTQVIDRFVHGNHIVGQSQTGTGKTAAFVIPLINAIDFRSNKLQAIVMAPTRELVVQTEEEFYKLARGSPGFKTAAAYGGGSKYRQLSQLERGAQVLVATPGRLLDYLSKGKVRTEDVKYFVLDEADRMLDMGFQDDIEEIVNACSNIEQMMSFSATITQELNNIITRYIGKEYDFIKTATEIVVDNVDHSFVHVANIDKIGLLDKFLNEYKDQKVIIFTQTKRSTDEVAEQVHAMGHKVAAIHGDIDQRHRMRTIKDLKSDYLKILVATDVAARGLNLNDVQLVINYEVPQDPESYIHRIGRTARAGKSGRAITFADNRELSSLRIIEKRNKLIIKQIDEHGTEVAKRIIDGMRSGGGGGRGNRFGGNRGGGGRSSGRFDGGGSSDRGDNSGGGYRGNSGGNDRGGYQGGGQGGYQGGSRGGQGGYQGGSSRSSSNDRPDYSSSPSQRGGHQPDRGNSGGGYRGNSGGNDRGGFQGGGQGGYQGGSRGGQGGGFGGSQSRGGGAPRGAGRDQGYRYRDDREAAAREGNYGTPPSKKPDVMFEPRQEYY